MPWVLSEIRHEGVDVDSFGYAADALENMTAPLTLMGDDILKSTAEGFATDGASNDRPWEDLTPEYGRWKVEHGPGVPKLVGLRSEGMKGSRPQTYGVSGEMKKDLLAPDSLHITPRSLMYLPLSEIAGFHQTGTPRMVARPPVVITERQLIGWDGILADWVDETLGGAGL